MPEEDLEIENYTEYNKGAQKEKYDGDSSN